MEQDNVPLPRWFLESAQADAETFRRTHPDMQELRPSPYDPTTYTSDIAQNLYTDGLIIVRHYIKLASDLYFSLSAHAKNVDLFMMTPSVSSPMGPGSDSEAVPITFGNLETFLVDSSQFGFEPLILQGLDRVYCYLPSMRGENPDERHLNQFFHCEMEMRGELKELKPIIEGYVRALADTMRALAPLVSLMSRNPAITEQALKTLSSSQRFESVSFDEAYNTLAALPDSTHYIAATDHGRDMSSTGERVVVAGHTPLPLWIENYDRDRVPFYQKPLPSNPDKVINADLIFPALLPDSFGGEIVGCGQRQDTPAEMSESLTRQGLSAEPYGWYMALRDQPAYQTTSGFGLGIERFIAWSLGYSNIRDVILYPRLKNVRTLP